MSENVEFDVVVHIGGGGRSFAAKARGISQNGVLLKCLTIEVGFLVRGGLLSTSGGC